MSGGVGSYNWTPQSANAAATQIIAKIKSRDFKDRMNGYEEMLHMFMTLPDPNAPEFSRLSPAFEKILLVDSMTTNKEKALQVLLVFLDRAAFLQNPSTPQQYFIDLCSSIIENGLSGRDTIKVKAIDCILMIVEIIGPDVILPTILSSCSNKVYKIATYSVFTIKEIVRQFGTSILTSNHIDSILTVLVGAFEYQIKEVRAEALALAVELYIWLGDMVTNQLKSLRPAQLKELETAIQQINKSVPPTPLRTIRNNRSKATATTATVPSSTTTNTNSAATTSASSPAPSTINFSPQPPSPTLSSQPSSNNTPSPNGKKSSGIPLPPSGTTPNLTQQQQLQQVMSSSPTSSTSSSYSSLSSLNDSMQIKLSDFYKMSEESSWSSRKHAITDVFIPLISHDKISLLGDKDYAKISSTLAKLLGDNNLFVVLTCINALELLVKKLSKDIFFNHIIVLVPIMLDSFKEKRPQLCDSIHACLNTIMDKQLQINDVLDFILEILLNSKVSKLRYEILFWFKRLILNSNQMIYKNELPMIINALYLNLIDQPKENRDICLVNLCTLYLIFGENEVVPLLEQSGCDESTLNSIKEGTKDIVFPSQWSRSKGGGPLQFSPNSTFKSKIPSSLVSKNNNVTNNTNNIVSSNSPSDKTYLNISEYRTSRVSNIPTSNNNVSNGDSNKLLKDLQTEIDQFTQKMNQKLKNLAKTVQDENDQLTRKGIENQQQQYTPATATNHGATQDTKFYETLNMELTRELQSEKSKNKELLQKLADMDNLLADIQTENNEIKEQVKSHGDKLEYQKEEIEELNEMLLSEEQMREDLMDEIERLKGSTITVGSISDPNRYLVELPKPLMETLPLDELELFEEVFMENLRIIQEAKKLHQ